MQHERSTGGEPRLTDAGQAAAAQIPEIAPKVLDARLRNSSKAEFDELFRLLRKFIGE